MDRSVDDDAYCDWISIMILFTMQWTLRPKLIFF